MRIQKRQCLFGILPGKLFLSIGQVSICKIVMGVGRIGISQQVELEDFDCRLRIAFAQMARGYDVDRNFRPQLLWDLSAAPLSVAAWPAQLRRASPSD